MAMGSAPKSSAAYAVHGERTRTICPGTGRASREAGMVGTVRNGARLHRVGKRFRLDPLRFSKVRSARAWVACCRGRPTVNRRPPGGDARGRLRREDNARAAVGGGGGLAGGSEIRGPWSKTLQNPRGPRIRGLRAATLGEGRPRGAAEGLARDSSPIRKLPPALFATLRERGSGIGHLSTSG